MLLNDVNLTVIMYKKIMSINSGPSRNNYCQYSKLYMYYSKLYIIRIKKSHNWKLIS